MGPLEYAVYVFAACTAIFIVPGQIFFIFIHEATKGFRRGVAVLLGVLVSEVMLLTMLFLGLASILSTYLPFLKIAGAILLVWLGISAIRSILKPPDIRRRNLRFSSPFTLGLLFTVLNPPLIIWLLTVGVAILNIGSTAVGWFVYPLFALAFILSTVTTNLLIVILAMTGSEALGENGLKAFSAISGTVFLVLAIGILLS